MNPAQLFSPALTLSLIGIASLVVTWWVYDMTDFQAADICLLWTAFLLDGLVVGFVAEWLISDDISLLRVINWAGWITIVGVLFVGSLRLLYVRGVGASDTAVAAERSLSPGLRPLIEGAGADDGQMVYSRRASLNPSPVEPSTPIALMSVEQRMSAPRE